MVDWVGERQTERAREGSGETKLGLAGCLAGSGARRQPASQTLGEGANKKTGPGITAPIPSTTRRPPRARGSGVERRERERVSRFYVRFLHVLTGSSLSGRTREVDYFQFTKSGYAKRDTSPARLVACGSPVSVEQVIMKVV